MSDLRVIAYRTPEEATRAVDHLMAHGIAKDDIGVLMSESTRATHFSIDETNKAAEGVGAGAVVGGTLGAVGAAAAFAAGIVLPGAGLFAAGPIMTALAGGGAGAATGGAVGGLIGLGVPEHEAKLYESALDEDGVLVGVSFEDDRARRLVEDLERKTDPIQITEA